MKVYISGPMTGIELFNYPAFHTAAKAWRQYGWQVLNPAENFGGDTTKDYREYMKADLQQVLEADCIALLPGWERSKGANFELLAKSRPDDPSYQTVVSNVSQSASELAAQLVLQGSRVRSQIFGVLNAEQKQKLTELESHPHAWRGHGGHGPRDHGPNGEGDSGDGAD